MPCGCSWNGRRWVAGAEASLGLSGLPVVTSGGAHWLRRLLWALILVVSFVWLVVQLHGSVIRLMYQNVGTESRYELMQSMPFPAITICAAHRFKKEQWLNMSQVGVTAEQLGALKGENKFRFLRWDELDFDEFYDSASYSYDDLVESCRFHGQSCAVLSTLSTAFTNKYGACHTITLSTNANGTWTQPQLEMRLTLPDPADPEVRETSPGWYVILHDSETGFSDLSAFAPASYNVLSVRKGQDTTAKMRRQETFYLSLTDGGCSDEVGAVDHAQCLKACLDGRLKPPAAQNSSETTPQQTNRQNSTGKSRRVRSSDGDTPPRNSSAPACRLPWQRQEQPHGRPCATFEELSFAIANSVNIKSLDESELFSTGYFGCDCKRSCSVVTYPTDTPDRFPITMPQLLKTSTLSLWLSMTKEHREEKWSFSFSQFVAECGGNMGIFLGASLLSLVELADMIGFWCLRKLQPKSPVQKRVTPKVLVNFNH